MDDLDYRRLVALEAAMKAAMQQFVEVCSSLNRMLRDVSATLAAITAAAESWREAEEVGDEDPWVVEVDCL